MLRLAAASAVMPVLGSVRSGSACVAAPRDALFRAIYQGAPVGEHRVAFRRDGERLVVTTHIDVTIKVLFFTGFRYRHDAVEVWQSGSLVSVESTTDDDGTRLQVSGSRVGDGFRILGADGPFLAPVHLLTSNTLWDSRLMRETRLIDVQHGTEVGLVAKWLGDEPVATPQGLVRAGRYRVITPHYAGSLYYDADGRWVKGQFEQQGEILEYALAP